MTTPATYTYRFSSKHGEIDLTGTAPVPLVVAVLGARDCEMTPVVTQPESIALHAATKPARKPRAAKAAKAAPKAPSVPAKAPKPVKVKASTPKPAASALDAAAVASKIQVALAGDPLAMAELVAATGADPVTIKRALSLLPNVTTIGKARGTKYVLSTRPANGHTPAPPMGEHGAEA